MKLNLSKHKYVEQNDLGNDYLVGDIHGHYNELSIELRRVGFNKDNDRLFLLGDIIDRGEDSIKCIELLIQKSFFTIEGNHERLLLDFYSDPVFNQKKLELCGGQWAIKYSAEEPTKFKRLVSIIKAKSYNAITLATPWGDIGLIHAEAPDDWHTVTNYDPTDNYAEWITDGAWSTRKYNTPVEDLQPVRNIALTIHGHVNCQSVVVKHNMVWIDTLRNGKKLTLLSVSEAFHLFTHKLSDTHE
jgi:hypothetical protein